MLLLKKIYSLFWPARCVLCESKGQNDYDLCADCQHELPWIKQACERCGIPLHFAATLCGSCLKSLPAFDRTLALFHYEMPIDQLIIQMKFHDKLLYAKILGELLASTFLNDEKKFIPDVIIPMPLHAKRLHERGYNQALELARPLAKKLNVPLDIKHCQRVKMTLTQSLLPFAERNKNMKNAFVIKENFQAKSVLIVDDVMTSGETCQALSLALKKVGVEKILICCIARAGN